MGFSTSPVLTFMFNGHCRLLERRMFDVPDRCVENGGGPEYTSRNEDATANVLKKSVWRECGMQSKNHCENCGNNSKPPPSPGFFSFEIVPLVSENEHPILLVLVVAFQELVELEESSEQSLPPSNVNNDLDLRPKVKIEAK